MLSLQAKRCTIVSLLKTFIYWKHVYSNEIVLLLLLSILIWCKF